MMKKRNLRLISLFLVLSLCFASISGCTQKKGSDKNVDVELTSEEEADMEAFYAEHDTGLDPEEGDLEPNLDVDYEIDDKSNSRLIGYTSISPNRSSPRNHKIDTITIHCMCAPLTVETCGKYFAQSSVEASSNYGIGSDGKIALYVEEKDRSWCSSNAINDNRAITIEVASNSYAPYAVSDAAYNSLIQLVTDICKRNGIKKLVWSDDKTDRITHKNGCNMTVHRDFAKKACPGDYLYSRMGEIADAVNKNLGAK